MEILTLEAKNAKIKSFTSITLTGITFDTVKDSAFINVILSGKDKNMKPVSYYFLAEALYQLTGLCEYLKCSSLNEMTNISAALNIFGITNAKNGHFEIVAINTSSVDDQNWLVLQTGKVTNIKVAEAITNIKAS